MLVGTANTILQLQDQIKSNSLILLEDWWAKQFLKCHKEYSVQMQNLLDVNQKRAQNPEMLQLWYEKFKVVWEKNNIQAKDCYNMDKMGFQMSIRQS